MSAEIVSNLQSQLKIYQQMFEQMENGSTSAPASLPISTTNIIKPKVRYIKMEDVLNLFNISKNEYNNILV
jgi:hypothetical protein